MRKTLSASKTFDSDLTKLERRLTRPSNLPSFGHSTNFDYKRDAKYLSKILKHCKAAHTLDLDFILHFLSSYNCEQRMILIHDLEYEYGYKLLDMVHERPESPMRSCTLAMVIEPNELYVRDFHDLLVSKHTGKTDSGITKVLVEVLLALNNDEKKKFKETYEQLFENLVEKDIEIVQGEQSIISKLLISLLDGQRFEESNSSTSVAKTIAKKLYEAGEGTPGIDYDIFIKIFTCDAYSQLCTIFDVYEDKYGRPIQEAIEREFQGKLETECFQDMVEYVRSPSRYYSKILREALDKTEIDYLVLIRIIIGHEEKDLCEIKLEYSKIYDETLEQTIKNRVDFPEIKRLLVMIISNRCDTMTSDIGNARLQHSNDNSPTGSGPIPTAPSSATASGHGMRRNRSHDTLDRFFNAFKPTRPH